MTPLSERDQRTHVRIAWARETAEAAWEEVVKDDLEAGAELFEKTAEILRSIKKNKVIPIRGPSKGSGM